jgi:hypothetical protein
MTIKRLKELSNRLSSLLDDPQPGFVSWCISLNEVMSSLTTEWNNAYWNDSVTIPAKEEDHDYHMERN